MSRLDWMMYIRCRQVGASWSLYSGGLGDVESTRYVVQYMIYKRLTIKRILACSNRFLNINWMLVERDVRTRNIVATQTLTIADNNIISSTFIMLINTVANVTTPVDVNRNCYGQRLWAVFEQVNTWNLSVDFHSGKFLQQQKAQTWTGRWSRRYNRIRTGTSLSPNSL